MVRPAEGTILTVPVSEERDHLTGPRTAPVTLLEYGDFECPHCGRAHFVLKDLLNAMGDQVRLAYRHFPLTQIHPHAQRAAEAAEAAGAQEQFWQMHDLLFENQEALEDYDLVVNAQELGLDVMRFRVELLRGDYTPRVREDFIAGIRSGVNGTPTFFINGRRHDGPWDLESLTAAVAAEAAREEATGAGQKRNVRSRNQTPRPPTKQRRRADTNR